MLRRRVRYCILHIVSAVYFVVLSYLFGCYHFLMNKEIYKGEGPSFPKFSGNPIDAKRFEGLINKTQRGVATGQYQLFFFLILASFLW